MEIAHTQLTVLTPRPGTQLDREKASALLTRDDTRFDALHAVVPSDGGRHNFPVSAQCKGSGLQISVFVAKRLARWKVIAREN
jgi:hypothetical protein